MTRWFAKEKHNVPNPRALAIQNAQQLNKSLDRRSGGGGGGGSLTEA